MGRLLKLENLKYLVIARHLRHLTPSFINFLKFFVLRKTF